MLQNSGVKKVCVPLWRAAVVVHPPALAALVSPGSPGPMSCLATAAHTLALSRTSVRCVRRSSPAAITCPNTQRSTAAPDPTGLSELLCDSQLAPKICPASIPAPPAGAPELRTLWSSVDSSDEIWEPAAVSSAFLPSFLSSLPFICHIERRASSGNRPISWPSFVALEAAYRRELKKGCFHLVFTRIPRCIRGQKTARNRRKPLWGDVKVFVVRTWRQPGPRLTLLPISPPLSRSVAATVPRWADFDTEVEVPTLPSASQRWISPPEGGVDGAVV